MLRKVLEQMPDQIAMVMADNRDGDLGGIGRNWIGGGRHRSGLGQVGVGLTDSG